MTSYGVRVVDDDVLPDGMEWMFVKMKDGGLQLWLANSSSGCPRVLSEAWAAYRCIEHGALVTVPWQCETPVGRV